MKDNRVFHGKNKKAIKKSIIVNWVWNEVNRIVFKVKPTYHFPYWAGLHLVEQQRLSLRRKIPSRDKPHAPPRRGDQMEAGEGCSAVARLKREDYSRTKHDSEFSKWRVLIGHSDWEEYAQGKEGAARYRVHNLPARSGPGVYELGIAVSRSGLGHEARKLDPDDIVVVYLGQADNVRSRLQRYGRSGAHLGNNSCSTALCSDSKAETLKEGLGLFEEIFSRGHSVVFRWAPMKDKSDALETEAVLLNTFDYGWNKGGNGARRPGDILLKLNTVSSSTTRFTNISRKFQLFRQGKVGIKIKASETRPLENCTVPDEEHGKSFLPGIFKFGRSRPRFVSNTHNQDLIQKCGFIMNDGIPCRMPPVPGRKRCQEHKGKRIYGFSSKSSAEETSHGADDAYLDSGTQNDRSHYTVCGINLSDGTSCRKQALKGRKRCEEHKGMRVNRTTSKPSAEDKSHEPAFSSVFSTSDDWRTGNDSSEIDIQITSQHQSSPRNFSGEHSFSNICGATLRNGSFCRRQPIQGNKRCWQHKGQRTDNVLSAMNRSMVRSDVIACGATLPNGSVCQRTPAHGRKRCEQHKGMRIATSIRQ